SSPETRSSRSTSSPRRASRERPPSHASSASVERSSTVAPRCHAGGYHVEWQKLGPGIRQRTEKDLAVILSDDPAVEENDHTIVGTRADGPSDALESP